MVNTAFKVTSFSRVWSPSSGRFSGSRPGRSPRWQLVLALLRHGSKPAAALHARSTHSYGSRSCSSVWEPVVGCLQGSRQRYFVYFPARCKQVSPLTQEEQVTLIQYTDCGLCCYGNTSTIVQGNDATGALCGLGQGCTAEKQEINIFRENMVSHNNTVTSLLYMAKNTHFGSETTCQWINCSTEKCVFLIIWFLFSKNIKTHPQLRLNNLSKI